MEQSQTIKVTVFTPTYNRGQYISNLYDSLCKQTDLSFEWVVVDQGADQTEELIKRFQKEASFPVIYHRLQGERGISRAMNAMMNLARGQLVMKVDDDDTLTSDAIETVIRMEQTIEQKDDYAGVSGLRAYPDGSVIGGEWPNDSEWIDCTNLERYKYGLEGDKAEAYYLKVMQKHGPVPTVVGEYYTWESILWDRIAHSGKKIRWFNRKIYIAQYLPGGATDTKSSAALNNFFTFTLMVSERISYHEISFMRRFKTSCRYFEILHQKNLPFKDVKPYFRDSLQIARLGYIASLFTRHIPSRENRPIIDGKRVQS